MCDSGYSTQNTLLMGKLMQWYQTDNNLDKILNIINGEAKVSLRIIDWFVTNYAKKNNISYNIFDKNTNSIKKFIVHIDYKSQLKAYSKKYFDPFCRRNIIKFYGLNTTIGQLNFFKWFISKKVIDYVYNNLNDIEIEFFSSNLSSRIEMHDIKITNDIAKMIMMKKVLVKKNSQLYLQPGGKHLMFFGIKKKLNDGESVDIKVHLKNCVTQNVKTMVLNKKLKSNYLN